MLQQPNNFVDGEDRKGCIVNNTKFQYFIGNYLGKSATTTVSFNINAEIDPLPSADKEYIF